jgi:arylsulfatase A-like enzyme
MNRRTFLRGSLATAAVAATAGGLALGNMLRDGSSNERRYGDLRLRRRTAPSDAPNVLFVSIDDMNDWLGFLNNHPGTRTPNLDALAARSLVFTQAYTPAPLCLPARSAVMFGQAPYNSGVYDHGDVSRARYEQMTSATPSLVDDLWAAGYDAIGAGKVFHGSERPRWTSYRPTLYYLPGVDRDGPEAAPGRYDPEWKSPYDGRPIGEGKRFGGNMIDFGPSGVAPDEDPDGEATEWVRLALRDRHDRPFVLGVGFILPHEPWRLPRRYFDQHPLDEVVVPEFRPGDLRDLGPYARNDIVDTHGIFKKLRSSGIWEEAVQAYQAAITYIDDRLGLVLDDLASGPYADDTIVVVWSDHGYHLGEKLHMEKFTLWERATRVPLLLHVPGRFNSHQTFDQPVSTIDLGPTIAELCAARVHARHDGTSLLSLVAAPEQAAARPPITTWMAGNYAVRHGPWRYIRYRTGEAELYDHRNDPDERVNLAGRPRFAATEAELDGFLPRNAVGARLEAPTAG